MTRPPARKFPAQHAEQGVALLTVMLAIFILTLAVSGLTLATMGETTLSFDQLRGAQALAVAEAGAYRALAELRRRVEVDLRNQVEASATEAAIRAVCTDPARNREVITAYAVPGGGSAWTDGGSQAALEIGTPSSPIVMTDQGTGDAIGAFSARILVRQSGRAPSCTATGTTPERYEMWFDYTIVSTGTSRNATRTVCLRSPGADACPRWLEGNPVGSGQGFPVLVERAAYSQKALLVFGASDVWMFDTTTFPGPVHMNRYLQIWGSPTFLDSVTQSDDTVRFGNNGSTIFLAAESNPPYDVPRGGPITRNAPQIPTPDLSSNPARAAVGLSPSGLDPIRAEIRSGTTDLTDSSGVVPQGTYIMDQQCATTGCGGIYIRGNASRLVLAVEGGQQVIYVRVPGASVATPTQPGPDIKIVLNPAAATVTTYWGPLWEYTTTYNGVRLNGVIYLDGSVTASTVGQGLYGIVQQGTRLTIAAQGEIRITDHLVYQRPPAGPGDNPGNVLGLWSRTGNVTIEGSLAPNNLYMDAAVLVPSGKFWVRGWDSLPDKGTISFLGGTVQATYGEFGRFDPIRAYGRAMTYDWRLRSNVSPPFFPMTPGYTAPRWPVIPTDLLYDKPHWEELVGR
ncbi:MAG: pilus assembly PilX N-terminal domain-containing protein [bacterium]|nr:pilus assembly PilX N-terminal domain-containing protein [bacterium]